MLALFEAVEHSVAATESALRLKGSKATETLKKKGKALDAGFFRKVLSYLSRNLP